MVRKKEKGVGDKCRRGRIAKSGIDVHNKSINNPLIL